MLSKKFRAFAEVVGVITIGLFAVYGMLALLGFAPALAASGSYAPTAPQVTAPTTLGYVGYLKDDAGNPLNTTYTMTFRIYATAGITTPLWEETQTDVSIVGGVYNVVLGAVTPLPTSLFDEPQRYLGITVADYPELLPRQQFASVPYAIYANNATYAISSTTATYANQANDFTVSGQLTATNITASGPASVAGLGVNGDATVGSNAIISGNAVVSGTITTGGTITANGNISWDRATGHLTGLTLSGGYVTTGDYGSVGTATMVPANNSICFLTYVWFQEIDTNNEDAKCIIDIDGNNWRLQAVTNSGFDQYAQCEARCLQW